MYDILSGVLLKVRYIEKSIKKMYTGNFFMEDFCDLYTIKPM